ncbi:hypothetical protein [Streptomyces sp. NPDC005970]|uniref:hypothetical protein n=1 Tax=Streptomyces sp. NPDC005970 TaxID=3156723 RepID=UPI0033F372DB
MPTRRPGWVWHSSVAVSSTMRRAQWFWPRSGFGGIAPAGGASRIQAWTRRSGRLRSSASPAAQCAAGGQPGRLPSPAVTCGGMAATSLIVGPAGAGWRRRRRTRRVSGRGSGAR